MEFLCSRFSDIINGGETCGSIAKCCSQPIVNFCFYCIRKSLIRLADRALENQSKPGMCIILVVTTPVVWDVCANVLCIDLIVIVIIITIVINNLWKIGFTSWYACSTVKTKSKMCDLWSMWNCKILLKFQWADTIHRHFGNGTQG